jgi:protease I
MNKYLLFGALLGVLVIVSIYYLTGDKVMDKKVLFVLMPEGYQDFEFNEPYNILKDKGFAIDVAGLRSGIATGKLGGSFAPNLVLTDMSDEDFAKYDALVIPGGPGSVQYLWDNDKLKSTIKYFYENKKLVASICYAVIAVVKTGILKGKKATVFPSDEAKDIFKQEGVEFVEQGCVFDSHEKMLTGQGPTFAKEFGNKIVELLR